MRGDDVLDGDLPRDPEYLSYSLAATCLLTLQERQSLLEADDVARPAGDAAPRAARGDAGDARDPVPARDGGRAHRLVAELMPGGERAAGGTPATVALTKAGRRRSRFTPTTTTRPRRRTAPRRPRPRARPAPGLQDPARLGRRPASWSPSSRCPASSTSRRSRPPSAARRRRWPTPPTPSAPPGTSCGGISPVGQRRRLPTVVDDSASTMQTVYVSGGRRGLDIGLSPADLLAVTGAQYARIRRET